MSQNPETHFAGAQRASGYVEDPNTMHADEVRAHVAEAALIEVEEAPEITITPQGRMKITEVPATPTVPAAAPADLFNEPLANLSGLVPSSEKPAVAKRGVRGTLSKMGIRMSPGAVEAAELAAAEIVRRDEETIRQATWRRAVSVLVANRKGGVGKTPVSLLLGGTIAAVRGGSAAIMEVADDPGALTFRAEGNPQLGIGELVRDAANVKTAGQLDGYTAPQTSFARVIGSVGRRDRLTQEGVTAAAAVVDEFYSIRVMDSGNQTSSSAFIGAVEAADVLVIPVLNAGDAAIEAVALLDELRAAGGHAAVLAQRAVIVRLIDGRPEHPQVVERVNQLIATSGAAAVFEIPYDAHIAERGQLSLGSLAPSTYQAFTAAAAGVIRTLQTHVR